MKNNKGFTLMEMLIVVALIAILVAIAIPTFYGSLTKARESADGANLRAAFAEACTEYLNGKDPGKGETPAMQADGKLVLDKTTFTWKAKDVVTVIVDTEGTRQG